MVLHKLLQGPNAGRYLPFGLARLRALERIYGSTGFFQQKYKVQDYYVEVQQSPPYQYVRITESGTTYFEFSTTAWPLQRGTTQQGEGSFEGFKGCVVGTTYSAASGALKSKILGGRRTTSGADVSKIGRPYQADLINEPASYPRTTTVKKKPHYPVTLFESWAPGSSHTGVFHHSTELVANGANFYAGPLTPYSMRDVLFDAPFGKNVESEKIERAYLQSADWPRASGLQMVTHANYGSREFAIYVDASSRFSVFPTAAITAANGTQQNVLPKYIKSATPTWPAWALHATARFRDYFAPAVTTEKATKALLEMPEIDWKFNHLGTKAAALVYQREEFAFDAAFFAVDPPAPPLAPFTETEFNYVRKRMGLLSRHDHLSYLDETHPERYFVAPGLLELDLKIELTGPKLEDFTVQITTHQRRVPTTMQYWSLGVGYVWHDISPTIPAGTLVSFDVERWYTTETLDFISDLLVLRNATTGADIRVFKGTPPIVAVDFLTLSFVVEMQPEAGPHTELGWKPMAVFIKNVLAELLHPLPPPNAADLTSVQAQLAVSGRVWVASRPSGPGGWKLLPVNPEFDAAWSNQAVVWAREYWARHAEFFKFQTTPTSPFYGTPPYDNYKSTAMPTAPLDQELAGQAMRWLLSAYMQYPYAGSGWQHCFMATAPRWGWNAFISSTCSLWWVSPSTTFYVHPNGTWAFWSNASIFIPWRSLSFSAFDPQLVRHVIYDRVHFAGAKPKNTTFLDLYNAAVRAGGGDLKDDIQPMAPTDLTAMFGRINEIAVPVGGLVVTYASLVATWDGTTWYRPDPYLFESTPFSRQPYMREGALVGVTFDEIWYPQSYFRGTPEAPLAAKPHVRFANPLLIGG